MADNLENEGPPSDALTTLTSWGITELLEKDPRPSLVLDLEEDRDSDIKRLPTIFANKALHKNPLLRSLTQERANTAVRAHEAEDLSRFKIWISGTATSSFAHGGLLWTCSTLGERWRIVNGNTINVDLLSTQSKAEKKGHSAASVPPAQDECIGKEEPNKIHSGHSYTKSTWIEALPPGPHVQFFKDTDWSVTPLGPLGTWPSLLRQMTLYLMADSRAACLFW